MYVSDSDHWMFKPAEKALQVHQRQLDLKWPPQLIVHHHIGHDSVSFTDAELIFDELVAKNGSQLFLWARHPHSVVRFQTSCVSFIFI